MLKKSFRAYFIFMRNNDIIILVERVDLIIQRFELQMNVTQGQQNQPEKRWKTEKDLYIEKG